MTTTTPLPEETDLTLVEQVVVLVVAYDGPLSVAEVQARLPHQQDHTVERTLHRLADRGVVTTYPDPEDGRRYLYNIS